MIGLMINLGGLLGKKIFRFILVSVFFGGFFLFLVLILSVKVEVEIVVRDFFILMILVLGLILKVFFVLLFVML